MSLLKFLVSFPFEVKIIVTIGLNSFRVWNLLLHVQPKKLRNARFFETSLFLVPAPPPPLPSHCRTMCERNKILGGLDTLKVK